MKDFELNWRKFVAGLVFAAMVTGDVGVAARGGASGTVPIFRRDLQPFGYVIKPNDLTVNHFDLNFLSEDSLLVSANVRVFGPSPNSLFAEGSANLLLFDVVRKSLIQRAERTLTSDSDVVKATRDERFVALSLAGLSLCSSDLTCGEPFQTEGPIQVSPDGRMLVVGGNGQTEVRVLDSATFKKIATFPWRSNVDVSGTSILLGGSDLITVAGGKQEHRFVSFDQDAKFLSEDLISGYTERAHEPKKLLTRTLDGTVKFETILRSSWYETKIIPATKGKRFCVDEVGYNKVSLPNLLGYGDVPYHFERVRVLETDTGKALFEMQWDPRPYAGSMVRPAISPDGHRLAIVRHGFLEVFEIP